MSGYKPPESTSPLSGHADSHGFAAENAPLPPDCARSLSSNDHKSQLGTPSPESEECYRFLFQNIPLPMWVFDEETLAFLEVNEAATQLYQYSRAEFLNMNTKDLCPPAEPPLPTGHPAGAGDKRLATGITSHRKKDGSVIEVELSDRPSEWTGKRARLVLAKEVSQQREAEIALRESEERFRQLADNIADVFWLYDTERLQTLYVNPAFEQVLGRPCEDLYRNSHVWFDAIHPEDKERIGAEYDRALRTGVINHKYRIVRPDGSVRCLRERGFGVRDEQGVLRRFAGIAEDITEREELEDLLRQAQKMEAVGRLAGGVAHDFNNLLLVIMGSCEQLKHQPGADPSVLKAVEEILLASSSAAALTGQLLAFSHKQKLEPQVLDLNLLIAEVETLLRRTIGDNINLVIDLQSDLHSVKVDRFQFEQAVLNLALNARDSMSTGGRLTITTSNMRLDEEFARSHPGTIPGPCVVLSVADTGKGMDARTRARMFEPFYTTKNVGKGTGLGLATVYGLVQQSGGAIDVESAPAAGTIFRIFLPAPPNVSPSATACIPESFTSRGRETILLVEDEQRVRQLLRDFLGQCGYTVKETFSSAEALRIGRDQNQEISLLLTDLVMPGLGGAKLASELLRERPGMQVLFVSGHSEYAGIRHHELSPGSPFLQKPFTLEALGRKLRELLDVAH